MELYNYKSFGGKTTLQLERGLNIITGPNGSGKSNIFDAIRFCLGENSPKSLRVDRLSSLISEIDEKNKYPHNSKVSLIFDNISRIFPLDCDNVTISRELKKSGEGEYSLNGKRVRKDTISKFLDIAMISLEGLNIVPQGMITRLSELSPDEKRRLIENIVGVAQFDEKKIEAEKQLQEADLRLQIAMAKIGEIKNRVNSLESERNDQLKFKHLEKDMLWLKAVILSQKLKIIEKQKSQQNDKIATNLSSLQDKKTNFKNIDFVIESLEKDYNQFLSTLLDESGSKHTELQFELAKTSNEIDKVRNKIFENEIDLQKIEKILPTVKNMYNEKVKESNILEKKVEDLKVEISEIEKNNKNHSKKISEIQNKKKKNYIYLEKAKIKYENFQEKIKKKKEAIDKLNIQLNELNKYKSETFEKLTSLKEKSIFFQNNLISLEKKLSEFNNLKKIEKQSLSKVNTSLGSLSNQKHKLIFEMTKAVSILDRASSEIIKFEARRSIAKYIIPQEFNYKKLLELADSGAIVGLEGRLLDCIQYDKKFEKAIFASAGKWVQAIIVKNLKSLLKIVEITKRLKIGRFIFIPLSEITNVVSISPPPLEGSLGILSDFISREKRFDDIINFIFGGTVLVNSNKSAFLVSSKGFKAVTVYGDIFEQKGSAFEIGYISKLEAISKIIHNDSSLTDIKKASNSLETIIKSRKSFLNELKKKSKKLNKDKIQRTLNLERLKVQITSMSLLLKRYKKLHHSLLVKIDTLEKKLKKVENRIQKISLFHEKIEKKVDEYYEKLSELNIKSINKENQILDEDEKSTNDILESDSIKIRELFTNFSREKANLENILLPSIEQLANQIKELEEDKKNKKVSLENDHSLIETLSNKFAELKKQESNIIESKKKSKPIFDDFEEKLKNLRKNRDIFIRSINQIEKEITSANKNIEILEETEKKILNELASLGYYEPVETFTNAENIYEKMSYEYSALKDKVNLLADQNYKEIISGYKNISIRKNQLDSERSAIVRFIESIEAEKKNIFINAFEKIDRELRIIFTELTGGSAWLEMEDPNDIFSSGVFLMTQFLGKIPRESTAISGGEKTVTALAFILSIQSVYPSPFYLFDEIDAHLDALNIEKLADLLKKKSLNSQIIQITLKPSMMVNASTTYGIYNKKGKSHIIKYKPEEVIITSG